MSWIWIGPLAVIAIGAWVTQVAARRTEHRAGDIDAATAGLHAQRVASSRADTDLKATAARLLETRR